MSWKNAAESMNWLKQTPGKPLFPDVLWNRPENKRYAGKLLIIGGQQQSFNAVSAAYSAAVKAGIGTARVILPDSLQKMLVKLFPEAEYAPSTPIGSFSRQALDMLLEAGAWSDCVLLAGDFGRNSETAILLESFINKYNGPLGLTGDSLDYFQNSNATLLRRANTVIVTEVSKLQKIAQGQAALKQIADLAVLVRQLSDWSKNIKPAIVTTHQNQIIVACQEQISTTPLNQQSDTTALAAYASVWRLQQPQKAFEAITTAVYCYTQA